MFSSKVGTSLQQEPETVEIFMFDKDALTISAKHFKTRNLSKNSISQVV